MALIHYTTASDRPSSGRVAYSIEGPAPVMLDDIWGPLELAARWNVTPQVVYTRKSRGKLPDPDMVRSRVPFWLRSTIESYEASLIKDSIDKHFPHRKND